MNNPLKNVIIFAVILISLYFVTNYQENANFSKSDSIFLGNKNIISKILIQKGEEKIQLEKQDTTWQITGVDTLVIRQNRIDDLLYPKLSKINAINGYSKLKSKSISLQSRELIINPDWDEDIISNLFSLFSQALQWTSPELPYITDRVDGMKEKVSLKEVKKIGLENFIDKNKIFSYAITSPRTMIYTSFGYKYKSPIKS